MRQALVIGIDEYPDQPLSGCVNDAEAMAEVLKNNGDALRSPNFETKLVKNVGTRAELRQMVARLFEYEADMVLLYFSGHGYMSDNGGYLVTPDGGANDPGVSMDEVLNCASNSDIKTTIIILDCCSSGRFGATTLFPRLSFLRKGMIILTSSREKEPSKERDGRGVFTSLLVEALQGAAADLKGDITPGSVYAYVDTAIGNWEQRPIFKANVARFAPIRKVKPFIDPEVVRRIVQFFPTEDAIFQLDPSFEWTNTAIAIPGNIDKFKALQRMNRAGLLVPVHVEDMYFAAMQSSTCKLTALGKHYWKLVKDQRL